MTTILFNDSYDNTNIDDMFHKKIAAFEQVFLNENSKDKLMNKIEEVIKSNQKEIDKRVKQSEIKMNNKLKRMKKELTLKGFDTNTFEKNVKIEAKKICKTKIQNKNDVFKQINMVFKSCQKHMSSMVSKISEQDIKNSLPVLAVWIFSIIISVSLAYIAMAAAILPFTSIIILVIMMFIIDNNLKFVHVSMKDGRIRSAFHLSVAVASAITFLLFTGATISLPTAGIGILITAFILYIYYKFDISNQSDGIIFGAILGSFLFWQTLNFEIVYEVNMSVPSINLDPTI